MLTKKLDKIYKNLLDAEVYPDMITSDKNKARKQVRIYIPYTYASIMKNDINLGKFILSRYMDLAYKKLKRKSNFTFDSTFKRDDNSYFKDVEGRAGVELFLRVKN